MTDSERQFSRDEYFQDPQRYFARLRDKRPVTPVDLPGGRREWLVTRYEDVRVALADARLAKDPRKLYPGWEPGPLQAMFNLHMLNLDPPDHTRLRRLVQKAFTPGRVSALRPRVEEIATALLDATEAVAATSGDGVVDLLDQFAFRLPITVICELLGVPVSDQDDFREWTSALLTSDPGPREDEERQQDRSRDAAHAMFDYFARLIEAKREAPGEDLLSALVSVRDSAGNGAGDGAGSGDALTEGELYAMVFLLLVAGFETTVNLIASGTLALLTFPGEMARLRADPSLLPAAVEELLRYANPLNHATERFTVADLPLGDVVIPAGEWVTLVTSSANWDPARFADPGRLDLSRDAAGHVAFGHGIHYCLGAPLARLEGEVAFGLLLPRFPALSLAVPPGELRWRSSSLFHGLAALPVRLRC
ncbi:MAG TPA: cytochrome P450 [Trebonia sp.]|nr:cytochrome P450 [Trebonia sp.]